MPILDSAGTRSDFFNGAPDTKKKASFGRKTESRGQLRNLLIEQNAATVDNRRGKKRRATDEKEQTVSSITLSTPPPFDAKAILTKTLRCLNADSLEKDRQKIAQLMIRNIWDKLTLRRRNKDARSFKILTVGIGVRGSPIRICLTTKIRLRMKLHR